MFHRTVVCADGVSVTVGLADADPLLKFDYFCHEGHAVVRMGGELDLTSLADARLALELTAATHTRLTVDCSGLRFTDGAGARFLVSAADRARASGGDLVASRPLPAVQRVLAILGQTSLISLGEPGVAGAACPHVRDRVAAWQAAVAATVQAGGASMGNLQLVDAPRGELRIVAQQGFRQPFLDYFAIVRDTSSACGAALNLAAPVWVDDVAASPVLGDTGARQVILDAGARAVASLPVRTREGEIVAVISVHYPRPVEWPRWQRLQLQEMAQGTGRLLEATASD